MKLRFKKPKGRRVKKGYVWAIDPKNGKLRCYSAFFGITTFDGYWWHYKLKQWVPTQPNTVGEKSSHFHGCRSVRAFRRRLKQWSKYLPSGIRFILCSRFCDLEVTGYTGD